MLTHPWAQCCIFFCQRPAAAGSSAPQPQTCTSATAPDGSRTDHPGPPEPSPKTQINFPFCYFVGLWSTVLEAVLRIRIRMFLGLPDPDLVVQGTDPDHQAKIVIKTLTPARTYVHVFAIMPYLLLRLSCLTSSPWCTRPLLLNLSDQPWTFTLNSSWLSSQSRLPLIRSQSLKSMEALLKVLTAQRSQCITWVTLHDTGSVGIFSCSCSFLNAATRRNNPLSDPVLCIRLSFSLDPDQPFKVNVDLSGSIEDQKL